MNIIYSNIQKITELCKTHRVVSLSVFGSILTPRFSEESDIDFVVEFEDGLAEDYADNYLSMHESLQHLLGREIDLLENKAIHNAFLLNNINQTKVNLYGRV